MGLGEGEGRGERGVGGRKGCEEGRKGQGGVEGDRFTEGFMMREGRGKELGLEVGAQGREVGEGWRKKQGSFHRPHLLKL